jgi:hypothetical protein
MVSRKVVEKIPVGRFPFTSKGGIGMVNLVILKD